MNCQRPVAADRERACGLSADSTIAKYLNSVAGRTHPEFLQIMENNTVLYQHL